LNLGDLAPLLAIIFCVGATAWIFNNWLRMRHGYPLQKLWGKPVYRHSDDEARPRFLLLTQENAELRAELGSVKDRLASVERIVTDQGYDVARQIESLREARTEVTTQ
jgi:hypothetical protein